MADTRRKQRDRLSRERARKIRTMSQTALTHEWNEGRDPDALRELLWRVLKRELPKVDKKLARDVVFRHAVVRRGHGPKQALANVKNDFPYLVVPVREPGRPKGSRTEESERIDNEIRRRLYSKKHAGWRAEYSTQGARYAALGDILRKKGLPALSANAIKVRVHRMKRASD